MKTFLAFLAVILFTTSCATQRRPLPPAQKGGRFEFYGRSQFVPKRQADTTGTNSPGAIEMPGPIAPLFSMEAPENSKTPSTVTYEKKHEVKRHIPAGSKRVETAVSTNAMGSVTTNTSELTYSEDVVDTETDSETAKATLGTSPEPVSPTEEDPLEMLQARMDNMKPIMWFGIAFMVLAGGFCFWRGWITNGIISIAIGAGIVTIAQVLPGHEKMIVSVGIGVFLLIVLLVLYSYYKGAFDKDKNGIPDFLERKKKGGENQ